MTAVKNEYLPETCDRLSKQAISDFWALDMKDRVDTVADTLLYDLAYLYSSSDDDIKLLIEQECEKVCLAAKNSLRVMFHVYHTASRCAPHSRLCNVIQNLITQTADSLKDWYAVFNNETPSPATSEEHIAENNIIPGPLKNMALQQILAKAKELNDIAFVVRNSQVGSVLYTSAFLKQVMWHR